MNKKAYNIGDEVAALYQTFRKMEELEYEFRR